MMWKEKYRIGVEHIDEQHKELFKRVFNFLQTVQSKETWEDKLEKVKETMAFMKDYVIVHFNDEEIYQEQIGYPDIETHKEVHSNFKEEVHDYVRSFEQEGFDEEKIQEFGAKLMTWLIMHVAKMDQEIGRYVKAKGGEA
jgi:hemerythrin